MKRELLSIKDLRIEADTIKGKRTILDGINLEIKENECLALVGESGSGKTITALSILRLLPEGLEVKKGTIKFLDKDILKMKESDFRKIRGSQIGIVFQDPVSSLNPLFKIKTQIQEILRYHLSLKKDLLEEKTFKLLSEVGIPRPKEIYNFYPHQLSGGLNQRVMIGIAVSCNPKLLILDEPTSNLDATIQAQILDLFLNLKERLKSSILFITHNLSILEKIADRICVIKDGRILEEGEFKDVLKNPKSEYTQKLLEASF